MAHELEMIDGKGQMFYLGSDGKPWHGHGVELDNPPTIMEGIIAAGLNWPVVTKPLVTTDGITVEGFRATVRETDNRVLGVVGSDYKPLQNMEAFSFFQPFVDSGLATLNTAGSLREGSRIWVLAKIAGDPLVIVPEADDTVERFVLLSNGHDGKLAVRVGFTSVRVVCSNTLAMAHNSAGSKLLRIRHHKKVAQDLEEIRKVMNLANQEFEATAEQYKFLASCQINAEDFSKYVKKVFNVKDKDDTARVREIKEDDSRLITNKILPFFEAGRGNNVRGVKGTFWAAYNAVTEFLTWERGRSTDNRLDSLWYGASSNDNARALALAVEMAKKAA